MSKVVATIVNPSVSMKLFKDYECASGPNFSQPCDNKANEYCLVNVCKVDNRPDTSQLGAKYLRLGFHDCLRYPKEGGGAVGGCDGCLHFGPMFGKYVQLHGMANQKSGSKLRKYNNGEEGGFNNGLSGPADILEAIFTDPIFPGGSPKLSQSMKASGKSRADLWAFAALVSAEYGMLESNLRCMGTGVTKPGCQHDLNVMNRSDKCVISQQTPPRFYTGRRDCGAKDKASDPSTSSQIPHLYRDYETIRTETQPSPYFNGTMLANFFKKEFAFTRQETVALMGAHGIGGFKFHHSMFKYQWQYQNDFMLDNNYYRIMSAKPSKKQTCGHGKEPSTFAGKPGGGLAKTGWWVRPLREQPSGGPFLWFHYHHRCPNCYKDEAGEWFSTEERGEAKFQSKECCKCNDQTEDDVDPECYIKLTQDESGISVDLALYYSFEVGKHGAPMGCPGLDPSEWNDDRLSDASLDTLNSLEGGLNTWDTEPNCGRNNEKDPDDPNSMSDYVEKYAEEQDVWAADFFEVLHKVQTTGYVDADLLVGPDVLGIGRVKCERTGRKFACVLLDA